MKKKHVRGQIFVNLQTYKNSSLYRLGLSKKSHLSQGPAVIVHLRQFHDLTGHGPMPGLWALGKHQCRWNYMSEKDMGIHGVW